MIDLIADIVYIHRQVLKSKKDYKVHILVELWLLQSRFWVYQIPPPYYDREVLKYMFRAHTYKKQPIRKLYHIMLEYETETCIWKSQYHIVMWSEKVRITCSMKGACATYLTL